MAKGALRDGDWAAVSRAITERLSELRMSASYLARETGLSPTTIRSLGTPPNNHHQSTLVAISAVLGWPHDYLMNIVRRQPEKNIVSPKNSPAEASFANMLRAEVGPMREDVAELVQAVNGMGKRIDLLFQERQADDGETEPA